MDINKYLTIIVIMLVLWMVYTEIRINNIETEINCIYELDTLQTRIIVNNTYANIAQWRVIKIFVDSIN